MSFTLSGFQEGNGFRRFLFERIGADRTKSSVIVRADVNLARKHAIRLQELPLICRRLLDTLTPERLAGPITLTEEDMIAIETEARTAAEKKIQKPPRRPAPN